MENSNTKNKPKKTNDKPKKTNDKPKKGGGLNQITIIKNIYDRRTPSTNYTKLIEDKKAFLYILETLNLKKEQVLWK